MDPLKNTIRTVIKKISTAPSTDHPPLNDEEFVACIEEIMTGVATPAQIAAFLVSIKFSDLSPSLLLKTTQKMLSFSLPFSVSGSGDGSSFDIVGTGGDSWDTFNISTATALTLAAMGVRVVKHGNRSQSGSIGSADFMEGLGANIMLDNTQSMKVFEATGMAFLFVQKFHPAMKYASPVRREIGVKTVFNYLGPLINPAKPTHMLVGVSVKELGPIYAQILSMNSHIKHALVVHSVLGMDELSLEGDTLTWSVKSGTITSGVLNPTDFNLPTHPITSLKSGKTPTDNALLFRKIARNEVEGLEAYRDWLLMNCGCALVVYGRAKDYAEGVRMTADVLKSGVVLEFIDNFIKVTNSV